MRNTSYEQQRPHSFVDRLGVRLSVMQMRRSLGDLADRRVGDFGCGYSARFAVSLLPQVSELLLVDLAIAEEVRSLPKVSAIEGRLPGCLAKQPDESLDVVLCISVLEHLKEPEAMLAEIYRVLAPGGSALINVPTWLGKVFLEFSAFRLGLSPAEEMDDHKRYYDPKDLWPLLIAAGFLPHNVRCRRHKLAMNTFAACHKSPSSDDTRRGGAQDGEPGTKNQ